VASGLELIAPEFTIVQDLPAAPVMVTGDRQRIEQVLTNLVQNAIKYSGESHKVEVQVKVEGTDAVTCVRDFGVGIPVEQQPQVFQRFFRATNVASATYSGLGLGLFISN